jgi:hypothetical protein
MNMLAVSYVVATVAMLAAASYLLLRLRLFLTTTTMLLVSLLLIYGPTFLTFSLSSGEPQFLIHKLLGEVGAPHPIFSIIRTKIPDLDPVISTMNLSIALMYIGIIAGIEMVDRLIPRRIAMMRNAVTNWSAQKLHDDTGGHHILMIVIFSLLLLMSYVLIREHQISTIRHFFSITSGDNSARNLFRLHFATSPNYLYRVILSAVAPMFVIWGLLSGALSKSWLLLLCTCLLFLVTFIGKVDVLSKAPPAFFIVQLMVAALLAFTNRLTIRSAVVLGCGVALVLYAVTRLIMVFPNGTEVLEIVYTRVFEATNQSLLENFATFPRMHPHMWGANIRPLAMMMGVPFLPAYSIVAHTWYGNYDVTSPALFIADAWADFSYVGVVVASVIAGAACRSVDAFFLVRGKTVLAIAVLAAAFFGIFTLLITALNAALWSGGLLLGPILAGLLVAATRYFNRRRVRQPAESAVVND